MLIACVEIGCHGVCRKHCYILQNLVLTIAVLFMKQYRVELFSVLDYTPFWIGLDDLIRTPHVYANTLVENLI